MKKIIFILIPVMLLLTACSPINNSGTTMFSVNGLKVILKNMPESDIFSAGFYLNGGVSYTEKENIGIEELLFSVAPKGTKNYDKETLQKLTEAMGTAIGGGGGRDFSSLSLRCLEQNLAESWNIYQDVILNPVFDSTEIELARVNQLTSIRTIKDNPDAYLNKLSDEFFYKGHPYANSSIGTEENVSRFHRNDLVKFHDKHFTKSRALLVVVGPVTKKELIKYVQPLAAKLKQGKPYTSKLPGNWEKSASGMESVKSEMEMPTNYFRGRANAPNRLSKDYHAFLLASRKLHTMVWEAVRTKRSLSYAPSAGFSSGNASSTYLYVTTTRPDSVIKVMYDEIDKLKEVPLTEAELNEMRMTFFTGFYMGQETVASQMAGLAVNELSGAGYKAAGNFMKNVNAVKVEDIQRVAQTYMKNYQFLYYGDPSQVNEEVFLSYSWPSIKPEN